MTAEAEILTGKKKLLIFYAPLDWGLGHTTRSVPLIREFLDNDCDIIVGCNSIQKKVLESEVPAIRFVDLPGYGIRYGSSGFSTRLKLVFQLPKFLTSVNQENQWLASFLEKNEVDAVISDNRYGIRSKTIPSVLLTHQLYIRTGFGRLSDRLVQHFIYRFVNRFSSCWVPDDRTANIAGKLSVPERKPGIPVQYIGPLSRLKQVKKTNPDFYYRFCIILSGPEPQRTILEKLIIDGLSRQKMNAVLIRGVPGETNPAINIPGADIFNYAATDQLSLLISQSEYVICRSGYSSMMDMIKLGKKMVVVPTPGQAEQEYLAQHLCEKNLALCIRQQDFSFDEINNALRNFKYQSVNTDNEKYKDTVAKFLSELKNKT